MWRTTGSTLMFASFISMVLMSGIITEVWPRLRPLLVPPDRMIVVSTPWPDRPALDLPVPPNSTISAVGSPVLATEDRLKQGLREGQVIETDTWLEVPTGPNEIIAFYRDALVDRRGWQPACYRGAIASRPNRPRACPVKARLPRGVGRAPAVKCRERAA